jgi:peptidoglycan/xylan/chitin deacetylase (PgdA/CDA1 family)
MSNINIPILMYHSIESMPKSTVMRSLHVPPRRFKFQMWMLKILGYKGLSLKKLKPYLDGDKYGKVVGITFDDGYQNNLINAAPILKKYKFSATCYLVSDQIGTANIWDFDKGITQRPLMSNNEIQIWLNLGMDIGAHTKSHADLTQISAKEAEQEIAQSKKDLESKFNVSIDDFCYPYGRFTGSISNLVKKVGYSSATTMIRGRVKSDSDAFQLSRIPINHHTLPHLFLAKILTKYEDNR